MPARTNVANVATVITLTLSPCLDVATAVAAIEPWRKIRCGPERVDPGGGGVNVSRAVHEMGGGTIAVLALGGHNGSRVAVALKREGVPFRRIAVRAETRQNFAVTSRSTSEQFRFVHGGNAMNRSEWRRCLDATLEEASHADCVVVSGSAPTGLPDDVYAQLARRLRDRGVRMVLDTSGGALRGAMSGPIELVKPSLNELAQLVDRPLATIVECELAAREVLDASAWRSIIVSLGEQGALLVQRDGPSTCVAAPPVAAISTIGAGDSMVAGIALSLARGFDVVEAVRFGVAAGSAAVLSDGTGLCQLPDVERLLSLTVATPFP